MKSAFSSRIVTWVAALAIGIGIGTVLPESNANATVITPDSIARSAAKLIRSVIAADATEHAYLATAQMDSFELAGAAPATSTGYMGSFEAAQSSRADTARPVDASASDSSATP